MSDPSFLQLENILLQFFINEGNFILKRGMARGMFLLNIEKIPGAMKCTWTYIHNQKCKNHIHCLDVADAFKDNQYARFYIDVYIHTEEIMFMYSQYIKRHELAEPRIITEIISYLVEK